MKIAIIAPKAYPVFDQSDANTFGGAEIALSLVARRACMLHRSFASDVGPLRNGIRPFSSMNSVAADVYIQRTLTVVSTIIALYCRARGRRFAYWVAHDSEADYGHPLYKNKLTSPLVKLMFIAASHVIAQYFYENDQLRKRIPASNAQ